MEDGEAKRRQILATLHVMSTFQNQLMAVQKIEGNVVVGPYVT